MLSTRTMQVAEAIRSFSIEVVVAYPASHEASKAVATGLEGCTSFHAAL